MKLKLNDLQKSKLLLALNRESATMEQAQIARKLYEDAAKSRRDIYEMICDAHEIDPKKFDDNVNFNRENGELTLKERVTPHNQKSIRKALKIQDNGKKKKSNAKA